MSKIAAAALIIGGVVVWTSGASEALDSAQIAESETEERTVKLPTFYFDDKSNALQAHFGAKTPDASESPHTQSEPVPAFQVEAAATAMAPERLELIDFSAPHATTPIPPSAGLVTEQFDPDAVAFAEPSVAQPELPDTTDGIAAEIQANDHLVRQLTLESGDTLSGLLNRNGLTIEQMRALLTDELVTEHFSNIPAGQQITVTQTPDGIFESLTTRLGNDTRVNIKKIGSSFDVDVVDLPVERQRVVTSGSISESLYLAAEQADIKQSTIMELANIFQWELDFARDIRQGDEFSLVYDKLFREGEYIGDGDIIAAQFVRGGKAYEAFRFTTTDGNTDYFAADGQSKRRAFMRHPVDVVRITSKFNPKRMHPVLHQIRAHRGVDYGSPHGSPIYATADGKVTYSGDKNAYGNTVVLQHGEKFSTLYAHMSRISDKSSPGARVKQGDVIGYVGNTGRVTGTHLHYEFRVDGVQIDPLKVELPAAPALAEKYRPELAQLVTNMRKLLAEEQSLNNQQVALIPHNALAD